MPLGGGPELELGKENRGNTSWKESSDFVFAFKVIKVIMRKRTGEIFAADYSQGAMLDSEREMRTKGVPLYIEVVEDLQAAEIGLDVEELVEDDESVVCAVPRKAQ